MQAKNIVYFLGSLVLILLSVYFVTGLLNISGTGLASLGKGTVIEGMTDDERNAKALERTEKKLQGIAEAIVKQLDAATEHQDKLETSLSEIEGLSGYSEIVEVLRKQKELEIRTMIKNGVVSAQGIDGQSATIIKNMEIIKALDTYGGGGGAGAAVSGATGGYF